MDSKTLQEVWAHSVVDARACRDANALGICVDHQAILAADRVIAALVEHIMADVEMQKASVRLELGDTDTYQDAKAREKRAETVLIDAIEPFMPDTDWRCYWP